MTANQTQVQFQIDPHTFYNRSALQAALGSEVTVREFLRNIKPRKRFRGLYWGADIIDAVNRRHKLKTPPEILGMRLPSKSDLPSDFIPREAI